MNYDILFNLRLTNEEHNLIKLAAKKMKTDGHKGYSMHRVCVEGAVIHAKRLLGIDTDK